MRLWKKLLLGLLAALVLLVAAAVQAVVGWQIVVFGPRTRPLSDRKFEATPERLERGRYLVESRYGCYGCHSDRDWTKPGGPPNAAKKGAGHGWAEEGMPWLTAPNITPDKDTGLGRWTDDAIARGLREGIGHDGRALFPIMPYQAYRRIPDDDLAAIVVYLRSRPAIKNDLPVTRMPPPLNVIIKGVPQPLTGPVAPPDLSTPVKRGEFLVRTIECSGCHTPMHHGQDVPGLDLGGGFELRGPKGPVASTNLTPDPSGIPYYDEALFLEVMRTGKVKGRELSPVMPWVLFGTMTDEDLKDTFAYLKTVPPVRHQVSNTDPPTPCKRCGFEHGLGERNAGR